MSSESNTSPDQLLDPATGVVNFTIAPRVDARVFDRLGDRPVFPTPRDREPFRVRLSGGMTPEQVGSRGEFFQISSLDQESWWGRDGDCPTPLFKLRLKLASIGGTDSMP